MTNGKIIYIVRDPRSLAHDIMVNNGITDPVKLIEKVKQYCDLTAKNIGKV